VCTSTRQTKGINGDVNGEDQLIRRICRAIPSKIGPHEGVLRLGIGDDAAIVMPRGGAEWVLSCDAFLEGVHFFGDLHPPDSVGYKSLVRATSDLAAMGATPRFFLMTLALPSSRTGDWLDGFLSGMGRAARTLGMQLAGGDTAKSRMVSISITVLGEVVGAVLGEVALGRAVTRAGAHPGDLLYVSGRLGRAELGLELMRRGLGREQGLRRLLQQHLYPEIRLKLGAWLAEHSIASAMMDLSDGLSTDLARLCRASGVGARLRRNRIPQISISSALSKRLGKPRLDPLKMALHGGDDYELLFTVPPHRAKSLRRAPGFSELTPVGEITTGKRILLVGDDGVATVLEPRGWDPFRKKP
jgi:thiamine-monophosphate kinase